MSENEQQPSNDAPLSTTRLVVRCGDVMMSHELATLNDDQRSAVQKFLMDSLPTPANLSEDDKARAVASIVSSVPLSGGDGPQVTTINLDGDVESRLLQFMADQKEKEDVPHLLPAFASMYVVIELLNIIVAKMLAQRGDAAAPTVEIPAVPKKPLFLLSLTLSNKERVPVLGDVEERYIDQHRRFGEREAKIDLWQNTISSVVPFFWNKVSRVFKALGLGGLGVAIVTYVKMKIG